MEALAYHIFVSPLLVMMPNAANPAQENARILIACESLYTWLSLGLRAVL